MTVIWLRRCSAVLICAAVLMSCDSPSPGYLGYPAREITLDQSLFRVYFVPGEDRVEVHRVSVEVPPPSRVATLARAVQAVKLTTGCEVRAGSFKGDHALMKGKVNCPKPSG